jgi:DNA-binding XRE family transcriptional regulator
MTNLKQLRKEHSLKQIEIAELLGLSKTGYSAKENGHRKFTIPEAITISNFFGVPVEQIQNFLTISNRNEYNGKAS